MTFVAQAAINTQTSMALNFEVSSRVRNGRGRG